MSDWNLRLVLCVVLSCGSAAAAEQRARIEPNGSFDPQIECKSAAGVETMMLGEAGQFFFEIKSKTDCDIVDRSLNIYFRVEKCEGAAAQVAFLRGDMQLDRRSFVPSSSIIPFIREGGIRELCQYHLWEWRQKNTPKETK